MHVGMTTFFQNIGRSISDYEVYRHEISMADLAEPLGFDSIWGAEHHFDDYTIKNESVSEGATTRLRDLTFGSDNSRGPPSVFRLLPLWTRVVGLFGPFSSPALSAQRVRAILSAEPSAQSILQRSVPS